MLLEIQRQNTLRLALCIELAKWFDGLFKRASQIRGARGVLERWIVCLGFAYFKRVFFYRA